MFIKPMAHFRKVITVPGDKSITHRAVMLNAIAEGEATVTGALLGEDCRATIECMRRLGAEITVDGEVVTVKGIKRPRSGQKLFVGNSGTSIRLLSGLTAGLGIGCTLDGDASIQKRPMKRVTEPLGLMGAKIDTKDGCAPIKLRAAKLSGIRYEMPVPSAQVKSALLLAGIYADGETTVIETVPTRDHTELMLEAMSADIMRGKSGVTVRRSKLKSVDVHVPGDLSSAAYPMVLASCLEGSGAVLKGVGVNPTRRAIIDLINAHGGRVILLKPRTLLGEKVADLLVESGRLRPFEIGGSVIANLIDEIPVLAVLAACIEGTSVIRDAGELRVKESDRIATTVAALERLGVHAEATADGMVIHGTGTIMGGGSVDSHGDHRIAMSMAVAAALSVEGAEILGTECVNVSYPGFFELFRI